MNLDKVQIVPGIAIVLTSWTHLSIKNKGIERFKGQRSVICGLLLSLIFVSTFGCQLSVQHEKLSVHSSKVQFIVFILRSMWQK